MSSLKDLASLIMVPSLVKDGRLDTVKPLGNSIIHPDATGNNDGTDGSTPPEGNFTFSRGSNLAATRVDVNGLIEKGRENLVLQSNQFDTTWVLNSSTLTSGHSGYNGSSDAWLLNETAAGGRIRQTISGSGVMTMSLYAKSGSLDYLLIYVNTTSSDPYAYFDLDTGAVGNTDQTIDANIEDVGSGWYRCSVTGNVGTLSAIEIYPANSTSNHTTSAGSVYIQDAQLESSMVATDYIETGASTAQAGILEDLPRLDYSGGASCPSLLLEPQRTNVVTNSEYVSSNDYVVGNWTGTITSNTTETLSPDGGYNATKFVKAGASDRVYFHNSQPDGAYTGSIYLKAASGSENTTIEISIRRFGGGGGSRSKLVTITNEWQRFDVSATNLTGGTTTAMYISDFSSQGTATEFYSYGMQIEAGSYPTSYIPTYGSAVTRNHDVCKISGVDATAIVDKPAMTLFAEYNHDTANTNTTILSIIRKTTGGAYGDFISFIMRNDSQFQIEVRSNNTAQGTIQSSSISNGNHKVAAVIANDNLKLFVDGVLVGSDTSVTLPTGLNEIYMGGYPDTNVRFGTKKQFLFFPTALTDAECIALTTI
jgi:hypothetical protein